MERKLTSMPEYRLAQEIIARSFAQTWAEAKLEWEIAEVYRARQPDACLCGHSPIIEVCVLVNKVTRHEVQVGNCCAKKFLGLRPDDILRALERVKRNPKKSIERGGDRVCLQDAMDHPVGEKVLLGHRGHERPHRWPNQQENGDQRRASQKDASA